MWIVNNILVSSVILLCYYYNFCVYYTVLYIIVYMLVTIVKCGVINFEAFLHV